MTRYLIYFINQSYFCLFVCDDHEEGVLQLLTFLLIVSGKHPRSNYFS